MDTTELELERKANIEHLNSILNSYRSVERKSKKILDVIVAVCAIAVYFLFSDLLGGIWGYVLTIAFFGIGVYCVNILGISFKNASISDGKLAYQACVTMERLIEIKKGTYRRYETYIICTDSGTHIDLYRRFAQFYPEYACKDLEKLSKIRVENKDIFD